MLCIYTATQNFTLIFLRNIKKCLREIIIFLKILYLSFVLNIVIPLIHSMECIQLQILLF